MSEALRLVAASGSLAEQETDAILAPVWQDGALQGSAALVDSALNGLVHEMCQGREFRGERYEVTVLPLPVPMQSGSGLRARRAALVGLGKAEEYGLNIWRRAVAAAVRRLQKGGLLRLALDADDARLPAVDAAHAAAEGAELARFNPAPYRTGENHHAALAELIVCHAVADDLRVGETLGRARNLTRDLTHMPPNDLNPEALARQAIDIAARLRGLECEVLGLEEMRALQMGAILAVTQGTASPARLIVLRYRGREGGPTLALIGKAVTFDTGGISIKPAQNMQLMKTDMAGGAAVLGALQAIGELAVPLNVVGVIPAAENMPSGTAWRPADIIRTMNGKTVETITTDAEGRMLLVDALTYAQRRLKATHLVDIATLTGACVVALGHLASGLYGNDQALVDALIACGEQAGEIHWPMPMFPEYREPIRSEIADLKNSAGREAGSITGAWFVREFVEDGRLWAHLDIAGSARQEKETPYAPAGPTGIGVGTFVGLAQWLAKQEG